MSDGSNYEAALELERLYEPDRDLVAPDPERHSRDERHNYAGWREAWIARGLCPIDKTPTDEGCCPCCGWTLANERPHPIAEDRGGLPSLPSALTLDEYAPAQIDEAA